MVAPVETHAKLVKRVVEKRQKEGFKKEIVEGALVIGTMDNIDKAQPGAQVYHSVMHRSWHGTSVQAVQPRPNYKRLRESAGSFQEPAPKRQWSHEMVILTPWLPASYCQRPSLPSEEGVRMDGVHAQNPDLPSEEGVNVNGRATETLGVLPSEEGVNVDGRATETPGVHAQNPDLPSQVLPPSKAPISPMASYLLQPPQIEALGRFQFEFFKYYYLKIIIRENDIPLAFSLQQYLDTVEGNLKDTPSNVVYVDVVNKPADSIHTMYTVMSELRTNESLWKDSQPKPMVGDAKTYNHMVSLIAAHTDFADIIPFPGDWHLLKNFQPVLMKIFYDAGLKQLAQESGFRAETLTSLAACSNFKRTNNSLLQAQEAMFHQLISCALAAPSDIELRRQVATTLTNSMTGGNISTCIKEIDTVLTSTPAKEIYKHFLAFLQTRSSCDHLWLFWVSTLGWYSLQCTWSG